jgi:hypothetical protein
VLFEAPDAHRGQHLIGGAKVLARIGPAVLAAQPFPVEQVGAGQLRADLGAPEALDRFPVPALGRLAVTEQGVDAGGRRSSGARRQANLGSRGAREER